MCGIYGVLSYKDKLKDMNELVDLLGMESAERGTDATGVAYSILGNMKINKSAVSAYKFNPNIPKFVNTVIGHTRHSTQGDKSKNYNNHPWSEMVKNCQFALAHNGVLFNDKELQKKWKDYVNGSLSMDGASALGMTAMIAAYTEGEEWLEQLKDYLDGNFAYIDEYLKKYLPKAHLVKAEGTYLAWIDLDEKKLEELMQKKAKVALDEGYIFGDEGRGFERINVASPRSVIEECMNRIRTAFEEEKLV